MHDSIEKKEEGFVIGIEICISNHEAEHTIPAHGNQSEREAIFGKIPHKVSSDVFVLYTDYEGDYTNRYGCVIDCEVLLLGLLPRMVGKVIPA